jgi:hypothetical protein
MREVEKPHDLIIVGGHRGKRLRALTRKVNLNGGFISFLEYCTCMTCPKAVKIKLAGIAGGKACQPSVSTRIKRYARF